MQCIYTPTYVTGSWKTVPNRSFGISRNTNFNIHGTIFLWCLIVAIAMTCHTSDELDSVCCELTNNCLSDVLLFDSYLACHTCITVIALLFSYIPAFMTEQVSKYHMTCSCSCTVACTLRTYNVLYLWLHQW